MSLCLAEAATPEVRKLASADIVTWVGSRVEIASAIERRTREGSLDDSARIKALHCLSDLANAWTQIEAVVPVCDRALRLLAVHALRAADTMQLAAALVATGDRPGGNDFVCTDRRLREAASREGFQVLPAG